MAKSANAANWSLRDAKARLGALVKRARKGPQRITVRGKVEAVVLSAEHYAALTPPRSFVDFLLEGPPWPDDLVNLINAARDRSPDARRDEV